MRNGYGNRRVYWERLRRFVDGCRVVGISGSLKRKSVRNVFIWIEAVETHVGAENQIWCIWIGLGDRSWNDVLLLGYHVFTRNSQRLNIHLIISCFITRWSFASGPRNSARRTGHLRLKHSSQQATSQNISINRTFCDPNPPKLEIIKSGSDCCTTPGIASLVLKKSGADSQHQLLLFLDIITFAIKLSCFSSFQSEKSFTGCVGNVKRKWKNLF